MNAYDLPMDLEWRAEADWLETLFAEQQAVFEAIGYEIPTDLDAILY
jgi:predicted nucleotidyltransferase